MICDYVNQVTKIPIPLIN